MVRKGMVEAIVTEALRKVLIAPARWLGVRREARGDEMYLALRVLGALADAIEIYCVERVRDERVADVLEALRVRVVRAMEAMQDAMKEVR
ncbi:MAG: hypothetical protein K6U09_12800 [Acidobacteriia bacterium]|nr:hypothetical protein [Terriglobia bacterium]